MLSRFPHRAYRAAVTITLAVFAFQAAIDHAARETLCCSYTVFQHMADLIEADHYVFPRGVTWAVIALALSAPVLFVLTVADARRRTNLSVNFIVDSIFAIGSVMSFWFLWTVSMGHSEPNWAVGFLTTWLVLLVLYGASLVLTSRGSRSRKARLRAYAIGLAAAVGIPALMILINPSYTYSDETFHEQHAASTEFIFAVLITSTFWVIDVFWDATGGVPSKSHGDSV